MDADEFAYEVDGLIEWCEDLDYDKYMENWQALATSDKADVTAVDSHLQVYRGELGEISVGLANDQSK